MKVSTLPLLLTVVGLALLQVAASPIRVYVISSDSSENKNEFHVAHLRVGMAAVNPLPPMPPPEFAHIGDFEFRKAAFAHEHEHGHDGRRKSAMRRLSCKLRFKAIRLSNWLRGSVGLPRIEALPHIHHHGPQQSDPSVAAIDRPQPVSAVLPPVSVQQRRPTTFAGRLHKALITLGPWEGRAIAFVLGCGIGSLLRMLYVLLVVIYRSSRRDDKREVHVIFEEIEVLPPPEYSDEQVPLVDEKVSA